VVWRAIWGTFAIEAQIHREMKVVLPNRALIFYSHQLHNHFPSSKNETDAGDE
jgi:hypothetical protein